MKQLFVVLVTALAVGCTQAPVAAAATLVGAHDMVLVDKLLFTTSTDRDELRVLDLVPAAAAGSRQYVRAPNPLEALSIPKKKPKLIPRRRRDTGSAAMA